MNYRDIYNQIQNNLSKIVFSNLWQGFVAYDFALYNDTTVYFADREMPITNKFLGNTAINYNGSYLAIWHITEQIDIDILTSKIVHEMFHAFQMEQNESRFPNEIQALSQYCYNQTNLALKLAEARLICSLCDSFSKQDYAKLLRYRASRSSSFEYAYETAIEQIEGTAQYVELGVLRILNNEKYQQRVEQLKKRINDISNYFPIRIICYDIGSLLLLALSQTDIPFDVGTNGKTICFSDFLIANTPKEEMQIPPDSQVVQAIKNDQDKLGKLVSDTLAKGKLFKEGSYQLIGVNVYSARRCGDYIYSENFLSYVDEVREVIAVGNFLAKMSGDFIVQIFKV